MNKNLSIQELAEYYVKRYNLQPTTPKNNPSDIQTPYINYIMQIKRILTKTSSEYADKSLWDAIKPTKGPRQISIDYFEKLCFDKWAAYIKKNHKGKYDHTRLEKDIERHKLLVDESYLTKKMEEALEKQKELLQEYPSDRYYEESSAPQLTTEQVTQTGLFMMVEAIYEVFFESFDWDKLRYDMLSRQVIDPINPDPTIDQQFSFERLKDYSYYVGERKI